MASLGYMPPCPSVWRAGEATELGKVPSIFRKEWRRRLFCIFRKQERRLFGPLINLTVSMVSRCFRGGVTLFRCAEEIVLHGQNGRSSAMSSNPDAGLAAGDWRLFMSALNSGDISILALSPFEKVSYMAQSGSAKRNI